MIYAVLAVASFLLGSPVWGASCPDLSGEYFCEASGKSISFRTTRSAASTRYQYQVGSSEPVRWTAYREIAGPLGALKATCKQQEVLEVRMFSMLAHALSAGRIEQTEEFSLDSEGNLRIRTSFYDDGDLVRSAQQICLRTGN